MPEETKETATLKPKAAIHPKELSSEYHKAHKQLMLWATVLFIWELVGVDLGKAKDVGGNIGPIVNALKSPQAVPWVLLILVIYFLFKCSIEWAQCRTERRKLPFARADFVSGWIVALAAITLYIAQTISRIQFADLLKNRGTRDSVVFGLIIGLSSVLNIVILKRISPKGSKMPNWRIALTVILAIGVYFIIGQRVLRFSLHWIPLLITALVSASALGIPILAFRLWPWVVTRFSSLPKNS